jgi:hypothetical protein
MSDTSSQLGSEDIGSDNIHGDTDKESDSGDISVDGGGHSDAELGVAIVMLNSVFHLYNELSDECHFGVTDLCSTTDVEDGDIFIGSFEKGEGAVLEKTFVSYFEQHGYRVERSSINEIIDHRISGDSFTTFLLQGVAERTASH